MRRLRILTDAIRGGMAGCLFAWAASGCLSSAAPPAAAEKSGGDAVDPTTSASELVRSMEASMEGIQTVQSSFTQEKRLAILDHTVVLKGHMAIQQPDRFAWHVDSPVRYSLVITGDLMRQWDEDTGAVQKTSLSGNPVLRVVSEQLRIWFSGRYGSLTNDYSLQVVRPAGAAVIRFVPKESSAAARNIRTVTVTFREDSRYVKEIAVEEVGGDRNRIEFTETVLDGRVEEGTWEVKPRDR